MLSMNATQTQLPVPNPQDWCSSPQAAKIIGVSVQTLYTLFRQGLLHDYTIGSVRVWWRPEIEEVAAARRRLGGRMR